MKFTILSGLHNLADYCSFLNVVNIANIHISDEDIEYLSSRCTQITEFYVGSLKTLTDRAILSMATHWYGLTAVELRKLCSIINLSKHQQLLIKDLDI